MRLIDADALEKEGWYINRIIQTDKNTMEYQTKKPTEFPAIEPERKKGKWIKKMRVTETKKYTSYDPDWYCACCGTKYDPHIARMVNFCYMCGADMRGEQE